MISKTDRMICGTCEYWTGDREPVFDKNGTPKISIIDIGGVCQNGKSKLCGMTRSCENKCIRYSKWTEIL